MLKNSKYVFPVILVAGLVFLTGYAVFAAGAFGSSNEPGSAGDPLVTRSFVENYVRDQLQDSGSGSYAWQVEKLDGGQVFTGRSGTDLIVRSGSAVIVDPTGNGIPDLTAGTSVHNGQLVVNNHLFTVPRDDGRGIMAVANDTYIMYRGGSAQ